ncbi:MAG: PfkB family carbohydrate kinase [Bacteroidales bacterium]
MDFEHVCIGEVIWEKNHETKRIGTGVANIAHFFTQFGMCPKIVTAVGHDKPGKEIIQSLNKKMIRIIYQQNNYLTGAANLRHEGGNHLSCYEIQQNTSWEHIAYNDDIREQANRTKLLYYNILGIRSSETGETIRKFIRDMQDSDFEKIFDMNLHLHDCPKETLIDALNSCTTLRMTTADFNIFCELTDYDKDNIVDTCNRILHDFDLFRILMTDKANGSYVFAYDEYTFYENPLPEENDPEAVRDAFTAGYFASKHKGNYPEKSHRIAIETATFMNKCKDRFPTVPDSLIDKLKLPPGELPVIKMLIEKLRHKYE